MNIEQLIDALEALSDPKQSKEALRLLSLILEQAQFNPQAMTRELRARLLRLDPLWGEVAHELQMLLALPESEARWLACLDARRLSSHQRSTRSQRESLLDSFSEFSLDSFNESSLDPFSESTWISQKGYLDLHQINTYVLSLEDVQARPRIWLALMMRCDEAQRHYLLKLQSVGAQPKLLLALTTLLRVSGASIRLQIIEDMVESRLVAAEPLLMHVAQDSREDWHVRNAALKGLRNVGTRQAIALLQDALRQPELHERAQEALHEIEARYPESALMASAGALSIVEHDGLRGALSLMGIDDGAISLYEDVLVALTAPLDAPSLVPPNTNGLHSDSLRLGAPPRALGRWIPLAYAILGGSTSPIRYFFAAISMPLLSMLLFMFLGDYGVGTKSIVSAIIALLVLSVLGLVIVSLTSAEDELTLLRLGELTQARWPQGTFDSLSFAEFWFQDKHGCKHKLNVPMRLNNNRKLMDGKIQRGSHSEHVEPILYIEGSEEKALFLDAISHVRVGSHGQLVLRFMTRVKLISYLILFYCVPLMIALMLAINYL